jgi:hypothetical protein
VNLNNVAVAVILFPSLCFTMKQLHQSSIIHNSSAGGILKEVLHKLVSEEILLCCPRGIKNLARSTCLFIKRLPLLDSTDNEQEFAMLLSEYITDGTPLTLQTYRKSCEEIFVDAVGVVQEDVYKILCRSEYNGFDLSPLKSLPKTVAQKKTHFDMVESNHAIGQVSSGSEQRRLHYFD